MPLILHMCFELFQVNIHPIVQLLLESLPTSNHGWSWLLLVHWSYINALLSCMVLSILVVIVLEQVPS